MYYSRVIRQRTTSALDLVWLKAYWPDAYTKRLLVFRDGSGLNEAVVGRMSRPAKLPGSHVAKSEPSTVTALSGTDQDKFRARSRMFVSVRSRLAGRLTPAH